MSRAIPPLSQYASMAWCSVKAQGQLFIVQLSLKCVLREEFKNLVLKMTLRKVEWHQTPLCPTALREPVLTSSGHFTKSGPLCVPLDHVFSVYLFGKWPRILYSNGRWIYILDIQTLSKCKLSLCLTERHTMKAYWRNGCIPPCILNLGTRLRWVVRFTPRPVYPQGKSLGTH
jgi:hypothetical protein